MLEIPRNFQYFHHLYFNFKVFRTHIQTVADCRKVTKEKLEIFVREAVLEKSLVSYDLHRGVLIALL